MRIQHNIMAMNAYRNYSNNISAMKSNLEKLSSGYKINRAGDDAAGLAISEKMRAQITGLQSAQKNAKDGISLVQTAEGALTEVHDMLNRMVELATQSANGTYDNTTDRAQLQKEMDQLKTEINRIADSANFNGIKLLDGSMDGSAASVTNADAVYKNKGSAMIQSLLLKLPSGGATPTLGLNTILETEADGGTRPNFSVDLDGMSYTVSDGTGAGDTVTLTIGGSDIAFTLSSAQGLKAGDTLTGEELARAALNSLNGGTFTASVSGSKGDQTVTFNVSVSGSRLVFEGVEMPTQTINAHLKVEMKGLGAAGTYIGSNTATLVTATKGKYTTGAYTKSTAAASGQSVEAKVTLELDGKELTFTVNMDESENVATTVNIMNALLNAKTKDDAGNEYVLGNIATVSATNTNTFIIESRVGGKYDSEGAPEGLVKVMGVTITGQNGSAATLADPGATPWADGKNEYTPGLHGTHNLTSVDILATGGVEPNRLANTTLDLSKLDITDGMQLRLGDTTYTFAVGADSKFKGAENVVDMTDYEEVGLTAGGGKGQVMAVSRLTDAAAGNKTFSVGQGVSGTVLDARVTLQQLSSAKDSTDMTTLEGLASYIGIATVDKNATAAAEAKADAANEAAAGKVGRALTLQIGDTAESFNQLRVNIKDMHVASLGLDGVTIDDQDSAAAAIDAIKAAINSVSDVRGTLGATQNRLDHTINNLSVMTENIQDAESTIRDTDVADEMMAYTKNNILIQSAQAMLAQANQVPQGVLQLLQ